MAFTPSKHIPLSKSMATINFPVVAQSYFYDETLFKYRPYVSLEEVNAYILPQFRVGGFDIVINFGGTLENGVVTGGENKLYWYDIGILDADLKPKGGSSRPVIRLWDGEVTEEDEYVTHPIDGVEYQFRSLVDGNTSEPTLSGGSLTAWEMTDQQYFPSQYTSGTTYPAGRIVWENDPDNVLVIVAFRSLQSSNTGNPLDFDADTLWWEKLGLYASPFTYDPDLTYGLKAVVVDDTDGNRIYISNIADNDFALDYVIPGSGAWQVIGSPGGTGSAGDPTTGTLEAVDAALVITWDTDPVPGDTEGRTYLEKHGALEFVTVQVSMPDPANPGDNTKFPPNSRFDEATKNILTIDNQGQKLYYTIGYGANGPSSGGGSMTGAEIRTALGVTVLSGDNTGDNAANTTSNAYADGKVQNNLTASTTVAPSATAVNTVLGGKLDSTEKGAASGVAPLDSSSLIPSAYLPSYVDDVLEFADLAAFPATGSTGKIYIALDTNAQYRWSGSVYIELVASPGTTDNVPEGTTNKYWTLARTLGSVLTGFVPGTVIDYVIATDTVLQAFQKLQGTIESVLTLLAGKANNAAGAGTSTGLFFANDNVQGTNSSPLTGNITASTVNAQLGITVLVIHNSGSEPTFDSKFKKLSGSGDYVLSVNNYIYCQYLDSTNILYSINQLA